MPPSSPPTGLPMPEPNVEGPEPPLITPSILPTPSCDFRWVHAGAQHLDLLPTPITTTATTYKAFSPDESGRIEEAWLALSAEERTEAITEWGNNEGEGAPGKVEEKAKVAEKEIGEQKEAVRGTSPENMDMEIMSGEEQRKESAEKGYQSPMTRTLKEYDDLEVIHGVPVSQVGRERPVMELILTGFAV